MQPDRPIPSRRIGPRALLAAVLLAGTAACSGSGSSGRPGGDGGGDDGGVIPDPPLPITGDYDVTVTTVVDTCGFGGGVVVTPMQVDEMGADAAEVDLPVGGSGECNRQDYFRVGNTLTRIKSSTTQIGACPVLLDVTSVLDFHADDTVTGTESNVITILDAGACPGLDDCTIELAIDGARCAACFACVPPPSAASPDPWGSLASAVRTSAARAPFGPR